METDVVAGLWTWVSPDILYEANVEVDGERINRSCQIDSRPHHRAIVTWIDRIDPCPFSLIDFPNHCHLNRINIIHEIVNNRIARPIQLYRPRFDRATKSQQVLSTFLFALLSARSNPIGGSNNALSLHIATLIQNSFPLQLNRLAFLLQVSCMYIYLKTAPFLEKYTNFSYGKRKTWIVASQFSCFVFLLVASFFTDFTTASVLALILMIT